MSHKNGFKATKLDYYLIEYMNKYKDIISQKKDQPTQRYRKKKYRKVIWCSSKHNSDERATFLPAS